MCTEYTYFQSTEEAQMLFNSEPVKQHIVLGTDAKAFTDEVHICQNTQTIDEGISRGGSIQSWRMGESVSVLYRTNVSWVHHFGYSSTS